MNLGVQQGWQQFCREGQSLMSQGQFGQAALQLKVALERAPDRPEPQLLMARCHIFLGRHDNAREAVARLEKMAQGQSGLLGQCAELYGQCLQPENALSLYRELAGNGDHDAQYNFAASLFSFGRMDEAESLLTDLLAIHPTDAQARNLLSALRSATPESNHIDALLRLLPGKDQAAACQLHYALGKEYEDLGEYAQAFEHFSTGASLRRRGLAYRVESDTAVMHQLAEQHAGLGIDAPADQGEEAIFVCGLPRSGTTLVDRILSSHPQCESYGEVNDFALNLMVQAGRALPKEALVEKSAAWPGAVVGRGYLERMRRYPGAAHKYIDKTPLNFLYTALIAKSLPGATIVWLERNPMDSCFAMYKTLFRMGYPFSYDLGDLADYYIAYARLKERWRQTLGERIHFQPYEKLVTEFEPQARALVAGAGMEWDEVCADFSRNKASVATASAAQVRRPVYSSSVGKWKHYAAQLAPLAEKLQAAGIDID